MEGAVTGIGTFIKATRRAKGMAARELAAKIDAPLHWINHLENGRIKALPSPERLKAIAAALDVPMRDLLTAAGYLEPEP